MAFSSLNYILVWFLLTVKIWIVPLSDEQANHVELLSNVIEYISALSVPLLTSYNGAPSSVEKSLIRVPLSLADANKDPEKFRAKVDKED